MSDNSLKPVIAVIDAKELRQAGLVSLLKSWDVLKSYNVEAASSAKSLQDGVANYRLVIFNLGAASLFDEEFKPNLKMVRSLASGPAIVAISDREDADEVHRALDLGMQGFISTGVEANLTQSALNFILQGGAYFPPAALRTLASPREPEQNGSRCREEKPRLVPMRDEDGEQEDGQDQDFGEGSSKFTVREGEVLEQLQLGLANKLIARQLGMTEATVKVHVRHIMRKLGATNRTQAALSSRAPITVELAQADTS